MCKKLLLVLTISVLSMVSCDKKTPDDTFYFDKGYGTLVIAEKRYPEINLVLSNKPNGTTINDYSGDGAYITLTMIADKEFPIGEQALIPVGVYNITDERKDKAIVKGDKTGFFISKNSMTTPYPLTSGRVKVEYDSGVYTITGSVYHELLNSVTVFDFKYKKEIEITDTREQSL